MCLDERRRKVYLKSSKANQCLLCHRDSQLLKEVPVKTNRHIADGMAKITLIISVLLTAILFHIANAAPLIQESQPTETVETSEESYEYEEKSGEEEEEENEVYEESEGYDEDDENNGEYSTITTEYASSSTTWPEVDWSSTSSTTEDDNIISEPNTVNEIDEDDDLLH